MPTATTPFWNLAEKWAVNCLNRSTLTRNRSRIYKMSCLHRDLKAQKRRLSPHDTNESQRIEKMQSNFMALLVERVDSILNPFMANMEPSIFRFIISNRF